MVVAVRVFFALALIALVAALATRRRYQHVYEMGDFAQMNRAFFIGLAALAAFVLVGFMVTSLGVAWLRDEGGVPRWVFLAANLLCLVAEVPLLVGRHPVAELVFAGGYVVTGLLLCTWAGAQRVAI